jgi:hypothetical protein
MEDNTQVPKLLRTLDKGAIIIIPLPVLRHLDIWGSENHYFSLGHINFHAPIATELYKNLQGLEITTSPELVDPKQSKASVSTAKAATTYILHISTP